MNDVIEFIFKDLIAIWGKDKLVKVSFGTLATATITTTIMAFVLPNNPETTNDILEGED